MKVYTYSEARRRLSEVLDIARKEKVIIKRRKWGDILYHKKKPKKYPFDVPGINTKSTTQDILDAVRKSRSMGSE